jgi:hypothetical protein
MLRLAAGLVTVGTLLAVSAGASGAPGGAARSPFDPFRFSTPACRSSLIPFRIADAQPAPPPAAPAARTPAATAAPTSQPASPAAPPPAQACHVDEDCPAENICGEGGTCQAIQQRTNVLYLYYREGTFREVLGLYWSKRAPAGYTVLAPVYWHYWTPQTQSRVLAPFFWRHENYATRYTLTVIVPGLPVSWSTQPGASSFGVWPLFYRSTKFGWAAPPLGSFEIADPDHQRAFGAVLFLYWWKRNPERNVDFAFPLFLSLRSPDQGFTFALPLNFYWRDKDDRNLLSLPFFYWNQHKNGGSLYALTGYRTREGNNLSGSLLWLYWFGSDSNAAGRSGYDVVFPLVWSFHSPQNDTTVAGPFVHVRRASWYFNLGFPLWFSGGDQAKGESFRMLVPLFYWQRSDHGRRSLWLSPIGGYSRNDDKSSRTLALFPFVFVRHDQQGALHAITPLFVRYWNRGTDATTHLISLLLYLRSDPRGSTAILFPLFWRFHDAETGAGATAFFPFFAHRSGPQDQSTYFGVFPLWGYRRSFTGGGWSAGLFPLAFFGHQGESRHAVLFPLLWHVKTASSSTTLAIPFFYHHADRHGSASGIFPFLTFFGGQDGDRYTIQFPLFWRFSSARDESTTTVTPVGYYHRDREAWSLGAGPLLPLLLVGGGPGRSHFALVPLVWHFRDDSQQRSTTVVLNYLHRSRGGETTDALFPLFHYRRGARPGGEDETSFTLFPFLHYRRDAHNRVIVTPLGGEVRRPDHTAGLIGPYFWYRDPTLAVSGLIPLHFDVANLTTGERTRQYGPWFAVDGPGRRARVLFPLFGRFDDAGEHDTYVFPTFFRQRRADGYQLDAVMPFFWHSDWKGRTTTVIGPWYTHRAAGLHDTGLFPIYFYAKNDSRSLLVIPPALLYRRADFAGDTSILFAGPVYHSHSPDTDRTVVFPLWWSGRDKERRHRIFFPLYWHYADGDQNSELTVAGPLFWSSRGAGRVRGVLPVAWHASDSASGNHSTAILPLFYQAGGPRRFALFTLLGGYRRGETSRTWYVGPVLSHDGVESHFGMIFPLWFSYTNKGTETTTRVIPPLLHYEHSTPEGSLSTWLALYWHAHDIASSTTIGVPLYFDLHEVHQSRTTVVLPLLVRHHRDSDDTTFWVAPLFYRRATPTESTTVAFPLVWDWKSGTDRTTVVFPLYAHWRRPTYAATYIFPSYYYREGLGPKGPDGTWRRLIAPLYESAVKRPGDYMWEVLGGLFGRERIGRNRYLKLLFMTFETQAPTHVQTSWYSQPLRAPRKAASRGLSANVW